MAVVGCRILVAALAGLLALTFSPEAAAQVNSNPADIGLPPGPLEQVSIGRDLWCQVSRVGDMTPAWFPARSQGPGDCGTFIWDGSELWAPSFPTGTATRGLGPYRFYTPRGQTLTVQGDTATVVTEVLAGTLVVRETDSYRRGDDFYSTEVAIENPGPGTASIRLWRAGDCHLHDSDEGYGFVDDPDGAVGCSTTPGNTPRGRMEQFIPVTPGSHFYQDHYDSVWSRIGAHLAFPDTCACGDHLDNGAGLSWDLAIPAGQTMTVASKTRFGDGDAEPPPRLDFRPQQLDGCKDRPVRFTAETSHHVVSWHWEFGDGRTSRETSPVHRYRSPGTYEARLTVTDANGTWASVSRSVVVEEETQCTEQQPTSDPDPERPPQDGVDEQEAQRDTDGDGTMDRLDNCPSTANPGQGDLDGDSFGDACDDDADGDWFALAADNCPEVSNPSQRDSDHDAVGDACDVTPGLEAVEQDDPCPAKQGFECAGGAARSRDVSEDVERKATPITAASRSLAGDLSAFASLALLAFAIVAIAIGRKRRQG